MSTTKDMTAPWERAALRPAFMKEPSLHEEVRGRKAGQGKARQGKARQGRARQGRAGQGKTGQGRAGQGTEGQGRRGHGGAEMVVRC